MKNNRELLQAIINKEANICTDYNRATLDDVKALYALALEYEKIDELERAKYLFVSARSLAISNANFWDGKKELVQGTYDSQRRIDNLFKHRSDIAMINKEDKLKELKERTSNANLTGNPRKDAEIYFKTSLEYAEIQEYEKARLTIGKASAALRSDYRKGSEIPNNEQILEDTMVKMKWAEYDFKTGDIPSALGMLKECIAQLEKNADLFSSIDVSDSCFYDYPRHIATAVQELESLIFEAIKNGHHNFIRFCEEKHLTNHLDK